MLLTLLTLLMVLFMMKQQPQQPQTTASPLQASVPVLASPSKRQYRSDQGTTTSTSPRPTPSGPRRASNESSPSSHHRHLLEVVVAIH